VTQLDWLEELGLDSVGSRSWEAPTRLVQGAGTRLACRKECWKGKLKLVKFLATSINEQKH
jgi:hypothetical protein